MKAIKYLSCKEHVEFFSKENIPLLSVLPKGCPALKLMLLGNELTEGFLHPSCPLPDWPEVSKKTVNEIAGNLWMLSPGDIMKPLDILFNWLRSIGVIIKEEKDEQ